MSHPRFSRWQKQVLSDLSAITKTYPDDVEMLGRPTKRDGELRLNLRLRTAGIEHIQGGLRLRDHEEFFVRVWPGDLSPPLVEVDHLRYLGHAHVLQGTRLCLYLDPSREWNPAKGFGGLLDRLLDWLTDASAGRFDGDTALFHAVGGVQHEVKGTPSVVVRSELDGIWVARHGWLRFRTRMRLDLTLERPDADDLRNYDHVPLLRSDTDLPLSAGRTLLSLTNVLEDPFWGYPAPIDVFCTQRHRTGRSATLLTLLGSSAIRKPDGSAQYLMLAVPHPSGGSPHLLAGRIGPTGADRLRSLARRSSEQTSLIDIAPDLLGNNIEVEWISVSDEREGVTIRRDLTRPMSAFVGKTVHVWGCGGLGSWVAEFVVRAGVKKIVLCDPGDITGGLLVRQNFVESDVGDSKVEALARRLRAISDSVEVDISEAMVAGDYPMAEIDVLIDATVSIAIGRLLNDVAAVTERPVLAHLACDVKTGTLGALTVSMPPEARGAMSIDLAAGEVVTRDGSLEVFHDLWGSESDEDEIVPTRGCSTPTFHGSAADMSGLAASLTSILGSHLAATTAVSGTHLISLPHGEAGPMRTFVPAVPAAGDPGVPPPDAVRGPTVSA